MSRERFFLERRRGDAFSGLRDAPYVGCFAGKANLR